jgi:2'-5' RNA ligase
MVETPRSHRLFFALWPDDETRERIAHAVRKAVRGSGGRPIPTENLHSTLAFLGSVPEERLTQVMALAEGSGTGPFEITLDRVEHWAKPMVLCVGCAKAPPAATRLADELRIRLGRAGFAPDLKPFRPHVTLARKVIKPHALGAIHPVTWQVSDLALVESDTTPDGSRYAVLKRWRL